MVKPPCGHSAAISEGAGNPDPGPAAPSWRRLCKARAPPGHLDPNKWYPIDDPNIYIYIYTTHTHTHIYIYTCIQMVNDGKFIYIHV